MGVDKNPFSRQTSTVSSQYALRLPSSRNLNEARKSLRLWRHPTRVPTVLRIWKIHCLKRVDDKFTQYQRAITSKRNVARGNTRLLWHGTIRACRIGDNSSMGNVCNRPSCSVCGIIRTSFSIARVGQHHKFSQFGKGIYTTGTSSKANDYVVEQGGSPYKAMLLSEVVAGKEARKTANDLMLSKPPDECDCVLGVPGTQSVLNYDEVVVYRDDAIRPSFLVIYQSG
ncbi:ADP-ribosylation [Rhodofomes roseus]|uniref:ADP-ribosylation n=1 Tax=Rhodofomes roseus TaxID=34475 RepID=A0ABQ8K0X5_9APHY|nr:ADP-ribosylation [Rhodofomes roseus]KAH9830118.1 ADP-ribosylation [Rhodofomes roseus]